MFRYYFAILFLLCLSACTQQEKQKHTVSTYIIRSYIPDISCELLEQQIRDCNRYESEHIGYGGEPSVQYQRFEALCKKASDEDLLELTNDSNAVMRCYAFEGLAERNIMYLYSVLKDHLNDTSSFESQSGCMILENDKVNWTFISIASAYINKSSIQKYQSLVKDKSALMFFK